MENNNTMIQVFENSEFGKVRTVVIDNEPWFVGKDVAVALGFAKPLNAIAAHVDEDDSLKQGLIDSIGRMQDTIFINESGVYSMVFGSKIESAKRFKRWVTSEVLPSIRKTGGYVANEDLFISTYLPHADEATKLLFKTTLDTVRKLDKENAELKTQNADLKDEVEHKENVIVGLVEDIDLAEKRQRIVQIIRRGRVTTGAIKARWALLYTEFEKKYHINLNARLERVKSKTIKNRMDVIDKNMNMIPQLFEICCKLYENDYNTLMKTWESTIKCVDEPDKDEEE